MPHHLLFEGAELSGKSWLMSQVYNYLEPKYNRSGFVLDGCHWFNCDVGIFGTELGRTMIKNYIKIFNQLQERNLITEKFHLSDLIYNKIYRKTVMDYSQEESELMIMDFKIILVIMPEDENIIRKRLNDRLKLYPHYKRIARKPEWYIKQQQEYLAAVRKSSLPYLMLETSKLPDNGLAEKVLKWIGEK